MVQNVFLTHLFLTTNYFSDKKSFWLQNFFSHRLFWTQHFLDKKYLRLKIILDPIFFCPEIFLTQNFFWTHNSFGRKKFLNLKISWTHFLTQIFLELNFFWSQNFLYQFFLCIPTFCVPKIHLNMELAKIGVSPTCFECFPVSLNIPFKFLFNIQKFGPLRGHNIVFWEK